MKHPRTYCWNQCACWQKQFTCQSYFAAMQDWSHHYEITSCTSYWSHWNCTCCITHEAHLLFIRLPMPRIWWSRVFLGPKEQAQENEVFVHERQRVKAEPWITAPNFGPAPNIGGSRIILPATEMHRNQRSVRFTKQITYAVSEVMLFSWCNDTVHCSSKESSKKKGRQSRSLWIKNLYDPFTCITIFTLYDLH